MKSSAPASRAAARTAASVGVRAGQPDVVGDRAVEQVRALRHPGDASPARRRGRSRPSAASPTRMRPAIGLDEPEQQARDRRLAGAGRRRRARSTPPVPGSSRSRSPRAAGSIAARVGERRRPAKRMVTSDGPRPAPAATPTPSRRSWPPSRGAARERLVEDREDPRRDGPPRRARVIAGRQLAQRQEELGHDDEDRQRPVEGDGAGHQAQADLDRDEGDRDGAAPFEHERRLERRPQDLHRRVAVLPADRPDGVDLLGAAAEHLERGEPAAACRGRTRRASGPRRTAAR